MSARRTHALASSVTVVVTAALVGVGGSTATAKPPPLDLRTCAEALDRAQAWPSRLDDEVRFRSDGFDSYLGRHPSCQPET
jgi:hypothetical protein